MTPDPTHEALLAAICENPEEDTPRLALADWLDENAASEADRARAAFIRTQIERFRLPPEDDDAAAVERRLALEVREQQLAQNGPDRWPWSAWNSPLPPGTPAGVQFSPFGPGFY